MPNMVICRNPVGKNRIGLPRKIWLSNVQEDLTVMGVANWRDKTANRDG